MRCSRQESQERGQRRVSMKRELNVSFGSPLVFAATVGLGQLTQMKRLLSRDPLDKFNQLTDRIGSLRIRIRISWTSVRCFSWPIQSSVGRFGPEARMSWHRHPDDEHLPKPAVRFAHSQQNHRWMSHRIRLVTVTIGLIP